MFRSALIAAASLCLLGQGCIPILPTNDPRLTTNEPLGQPSPDGFISFREGFGKLPGTPVRTDIPAARVVLNTQLPEIPTEVTVLREWDSAPNEAVLRNLTTALQVPAGVLGANPKGEALTIRWTDGKQFVWTYDAQTQSLIFEREGANALTEKPIARLDRAAETASAFLADRGVNLHGAGDPVASTMEVAFSAARDELPVLDQNGTAVLAASVRTDPTGTSVLRGRFALPPTGIDRSNYPALSQGELLERLRAGGINPITDPALTVSFNEITFAHLRETAMLNGHSRVIYIPALLAKGTVRVGERTEAYATMIPLVKDSTLANPAGILR